MNITLFRMVCIVQFMLAGYMAVASFVFIFETPGLYSVISFIAYCLAVYMVVFLLQVMYKNHPDTPLSISQKALFNRIFILNFLMFSVLLSYNINDVKLILDISNKELQMSSNFAYASIALHFCISVFQVYILLYMVKLRRSLNNNFEKKSLDLDILAG